MMRNWCFIIGITICSAESVLAVEIGQEAPRFEGERWQSGETVSLSDFEGEILVLDFFAYWCVPCRHSSPLLESEIQSYYDERGGNAYGIPVRVISVNVEEGNSDKTARFLAETGSRYVVNDRKGENLSRFGAQGIPFFVVVDGSNKGRDEPFFEIAYQNAGFEGVEKLRGVIDGIEGTDSEVSGREVVAPKQGVPSDLERSARLAEISDLPEDEVSESPPSDREFGVDTEVVVSKDVVLTQSTLLMRWSEWDRELTLSGSFSSIDLDYEPVPFDFLGSPNKVSEDRFAFQASYRKRVKDRLQLQGSTGLYDGITDFRSAWLNEYYRQQFSEIEGYEVADAGGFNVSGAVSWEYLPNSGIFQIDAGFLRDTIAPGYEIDFDGLFRGRDRLDSWTVQVSSENVINRWIRAHNALSLIGTTERETRLSYLGRLNLALGERMVVRSSLGATKEDPELKAYFVGSSIEYELGKSVLLSVSGRYYKDTGEIENSLLFSNAAPGLESYQAGVGLRVLWPNASLKLYAAAYHTSYDEIDFGTIFFENLYSSRDWGIIQFAFTKNF